MGGLFGEGIVFINDLLCLGKEARSGGIMHLWCALLFAVVQRGKPFNSR